uniref:Uncharacterized protein n=1 Tax=Rousettus aegyptiacus TaxID=9407 RepID=A0A7J8F0C0_ROUAE|nr:hypothetical protein HJG63_012279 [Rousettus aegyptiacus]
MPRPPPVTPALPWSCLRPGPWAADQKMCRPSASSASTGRRRRSCWKRSHCRAPRPSPAQARSRERNGGPLLWSRKSRGRDPVEPRQPFLVSLAGAPVLQQTSRVANSWSWSQPPGLRPSPLLWVPKGPGAVLTWQPCHPWSNVTA